MARGRIPLQALTPLSLNWEPAYSSEAEVASSICETKHDNDQWDLVGAFIASVEELRTVS